MNGYEPAASAATEEGAGAVRLNDMLCGCRSHCDIKRSKDFIHSSTTRPSTAHAGFTSSTATDRTGYELSKGTPVVHFHGSAKAARLPAKNRKTDAAESDALQAGCLSGIP